MFKFKCGECDEWHEGAPSIAFRLPDYCGPFSPEDLRARANLSDDMIVVDNQYYFIRACLEVPIQGLDEGFMWGIWASVSHESFEKYRRSYQGEVPPDGPYFSWLGNNIPGYPSVEGLKAQSLPQTDGTRPHIRLEKSDHPLSVDFHQGMPYDRAVAIFERILHGGRAS